MRPEHSYYIYILLFFSKDRVDIFKVPLRHPHAYGLLIKKSQSKALAKICKERRGVRLIR